MTLFIRLIYIFFLNFCKLDRVLCINNYSTSTYILVSVLLKNMILLYTIFPRITDL